MFISDIQVGKSYKHLSTKDVVKCVAITPRGTPIIENENGVESIITNPGYASCLVLCAEKKKINLYYRLWAYSDNPFMQVSCSTKPLYGRAPNVKVFKEWEEEIEYEVPQY